MIRMKNLNCPNCGAPIEPFKNKCEYCHTSYFDLSSIDINDNKPFYLKLKYNNIIMTQLVQCVPTINLNLTQDRIYCHKGNELITSFLAVPSLSTDLSFKAIPNSKGQLCEIIYRENL